MPTAFEELFGIKFFFQNFIAATAKFTETAIMITALVGVLMGTILLVAITKVRNTNEKK